ncbi:hypothetical protein [Roseateles puraquae]|uniref:hypothetical protein n=1 Tax=Roseateles puraquae TaxID=431059 RepID=UPI00118565D6|nr:hypothetical protein [Roseateles puraquae]
MTRDSRQALGRRFALTCCIAIPVSLCYAADGTVGFGDSLVYQGHTVKLRKSYQDYDEFSNDLNNLAPGEAARVAKLVESTPLPTGFPDRRLMVAALLRLKFPGYGLQAYGERILPGGSALSLFGVEVPQAGRTRFLLFRKSGDSFNLVDDFVLSDGADIADVTVKDGKLVYLSRQGLVVLERPSPQ